jgi:hypothetical protein
MKRDKRGRFIKSKSKRGGKSATKADLGKKKNWNGTKTLKEIWTRWLKGKGIYHDGTKINWVSLARVEGFSPYIANKFWLMIGGTKSETSHQRIERVYGRKKKSRR